ncbi:MULTISPECIES: hypothetical protein [Mesorhizobium]|uniref:Uncharacterized protein n=2 Tax=Mesorhizobium TaxID=68287 RepID=G6Y2V4_9HYPH|nr:MULTISPECIES: hypothetical protein [Mesorhizobium]ANT54465.1 hypothetical protein A6B35_30960 [Mesorhizobium amorphae CCNWGS0123]EHH13931.1 hypothetical protein MEA186_01351 [Mesorhizobium amorphae CCNWGS0123]MCV3243862.1 hypothetical protein [Mesorhizobium sp. ZC-5]
MSDEPARFGPVDVLQIASKLTIDDATFVIGGQATNLWAWFYQDRTPELSSSSELTSKDIDYFGTKKAAESLAQALGGKVYLPNADDMNTPNTAVVVAEVNGKKLQIDFMHGVLGLTKRELENGVSVIRLEADSDGKLLRADVAVMHPVLCLKSRVANMLSPATMRRDKFAWKQLYATIAILEVYIRDALDDGDIKEVNRCFREIFNYLRSDRYGRRVVDELGVDPLKILETFASDSCLDERYRELTLGKMIDRIVTARQRRHDT